MSEPETGPVVRAQDVRREFDDGGRRLPVLRGASLELARGEIVALVGRSGSGKSTLLHLLGLLDRPDGGDIALLGQATGGLSETERSRLRAAHVGFVFQHYFLLPEFTVQENVLLAAQVASGLGQWAARSGAARQRAAELLDLCGLKDLARRRIAVLSGGERQRVALARALMRQPAVLLCDEPTGNLDPDTGARIMDLIFGLSRRDRVAALVVTHDQALVERANRVLRLEHGQLAPLR